MIGPAGGTVNGSAGSQVVVPANALAAPVSVGIAQTSTGARALPAGFVDPGLMFALTPHGTSFALPATIRVPFDSSLFPAGIAPVLYKTNAAQNGWDVVAGATVVGNAMQAQISSFSWIVIPVPLSLPTIAVQPANQSPIEPGTATFSVGATGPTLSGTLSFQWKRNGVVIPGATNNVYTTGATSVATDNGALYSVDVSNLAGTVTSGDALLTVTTAVVAPAINPQPADASVAVGASATFSVVATGTSPVFQWQRSIDGGVSFNDIPGANTTSFTLTNAQLSDSGSKFRVHVSNAAGMLDSSAATLTVSAGAPAANSVRIAAGNGFSLAVNTAGVPSSWGIDAIGQLGNGPATGNRSTAAPLGTITGVLSVSAGSGSQGVAVKTDGTVWAWGYGGSIDCSFGSISPAPFQIPGAANITAASAGGDHTLVLRSDGVVLSFGCNDSGQLGRSGMLPSAAATVVPGLPAIAAVAAGVDFSLALDRNGNVWSWGRGALGDGSAASVMRATPAQIAGLAGVTAIAAGSRHALALKSDGSVVAWGSNANGKLGNGAEVDQTRPVATLLTQRITAIAAGEDNSLALRDDGVVLSWGVNETGQLGSGFLTPGFRSAPAPVVGLAGVVAIAFGSSLGHGLALHSDGTVRAWGHNDAGQLGNGGTAFQLSPVVVTGLNLN
ncbi:MAG: hypothetical protein ABI699_04035 [Caldimonas sp.]